MRWKPIPDSKGYTVSDTGLVKNADGRILKGSISDRGYRKHRMVINGRSTSIGAHALVLMAFVGPRPSPKHHTLHLDDVKLNNSLSNLRWGTPSENMQQQLERGHHSSSNGKSHWAKLTREQVIKIRSEMKSDYSYKYGLVQHNDVELAKKYGVGRTTIRDIRNRATWNHNTPAAPLEAVRKVLEHDCLLDMSVAYNSDYLRGWNEAIKYRDAEFRRALTSSHKEAK